MSVSLKYVSLATLDELSRDIRKNLTRYRKGDFEDCIPGGDWSIPLKEAMVDLESLTDLDPSGGPEAEISNSILVWKVFGNLKPSIACEDRIWTRLCHVECLNYARDRWLAGIDDDEKAAKSILTHFFAGTLNKCRDDNALSRLWWNAYIAQQLRPYDQEAALRLILKSADIRSNFVERSMISSRRSVGDAILRAMERHDWITSAEANFRQYMVTLNRRGGGVAFELLKQQAIDAFMDRVLEYCQPSPQAA